MSPIPCFAQTMVHSHFNVPPPTMRTRAVQGCRRYACARLGSSTPTTPRSLPAFPGGGSWAEPFLKTAHKRIPTERVQFRASLSSFRLHPPVPGLFWFRARVILLADGPTRPIQRLPIPGTVRPFPHPEPPLLFVFFPVAPSPRERSSNVVHVPSSRGVVTSGGDVQRF